ncbi:hypothetical protein ACN24L_27885 [Streptomyces microflavus]
MVPGTGGVPPRLSDDTAILTPQSPGPDSGHVSGSTLTSGIPVVPSEPRSTFPGRPDVTGGPGVSAAPAAGPVALAAPVAPGPFPGGPGATGVPAPGTAAARPAPKPAPAPAPAKKGRSSWSSSAWLRSCCSASPTAPASS